MAAPGKLTPEVTEQLLELLAEGEPLTVAALEVGVSRRAVQLKAAQDPELRRRIAEARGQARARVVNPPAGSTPPDRAELLRRLDAQSRSGSTRATELLLRERAQDRAAAAPDPFAELDAIAAAEQVWPSRN